MHANDIKITIIFIVYTCDYENIESYIENILQVQVINIK